MGGGAKAGFTRQSHSFEIIAKDYYNNHRSTGGDVFTVLLKGPVR